MGVKINQDNLLIFPDQQRTFAHRNHQAWAYQRSTDMRMAVVIVPCGFMLIMGIIRNQPLHHRPKVMLDQPRFKFDSRQSRR